MATLLYKVIKTKNRYAKYCGILETLTADRLHLRVAQDGIELLTLLIEKYDEEQGPDYNADPVEILKYLMNDHGMKAVDLAKLLNVSKGLVVDMLQYKRRFSKENIRILAQRFKLNPEAFNRPYDLKPCKDKTPGP